ncbi:MAG TPA: hypothetical protein VKV02_08060 [Acidobacteriaceae bacterium]|nr:hypothetical protein [Acidobacteriaceae bacterium]
MMLFENRFAVLRSFGLLTLGFALPLLGAAALAQTPAPGTSSSTSQTGTTAAPGTAPIRSRATAQAIAPVRVTTYDDKFEIFGGLSLMNGQAGQDLPKRYNMGGGEIMGTYWLGSHLGVAADYRIEAGTTDLIPTPQLANTRALVIQNIISGGVNYRGPKNRYAAVDYHALVGITHGQFDHSIKNDAALPANTPPSTFGLYNNSTSPWGAIGGSIDFNTTPKLAVRLSPDLIFEHFGTETREFFSLGGGVVYRFGKRK